MLSWLAKGIASTEITVAHPSPQNVLVMHVHADYHDASGAAPSAVCGCCVFISTTRDPNVIETNRQGADDTSMGDDDCADGDGGLRAEIVTMTIMMQTLQPPATAVC